MGVVLLHVLTRLLKNRMTAIWNTDGSLKCSFCGPTRKQSNIWKVHGQLNEAVGKTSNSTPLAQTKLEVPSSEGKKDDLAEESAVQNGAPDASSISAFMDQVSELVKLVDSRDIIELQLKQLDCELIIRKKEALPQAPVAAPVVMMQPPPQGMVSSQLPQAPPTAPASPSPAPSAPALALPPPPAKSKSSHPPLKCPMAGTFYRCPGPGEPPFVKVGDKVQKGQVVCIIEAMKLMNEIEADQSGTIVEVLVEDGKPVSVDMPLFVIEP
ncbi:Biotin/lipoyl attachment [Macleaya cordata]|uniref:Biotin carboxyl carrier protein of acetyl-CoA carboxylase n=1 Tax=Macleaya cordata TaxID=56857 RepID=A0A200QBP4_MACCD|nr:Biotin/lipoyl attachment [Macleaya cordata]